MGSPTKTVELKRKRNARTEGKARKRALKAGSTPRFPVHLEEAPECVLPQAPGTGKTVI